MEYYIKKTTKYTLTPPTKTPSSYSQSDLDAGIDGLVLCGRSEDPAVIGNPFKCGGSCPSRRRRRGKFYRKDKIT